MLFHCVYPTYRRDTCWALLPSACCMNELNNDDACAKTQGGDRGEGLWETDDRKAERNCENAKDTRRFMKVHETNSKANLASQKGRHKKITSDPTDSRVPTHDSTLMKIHYWFKISSVESDNFDSPCRSSRLLF